VLMAKNAYVWLSQLGQQFNRPITRLDQIPDETLDQLAEWGFSGLWLIGLWQRSRASATIKQLCGNPDAIASAYSLADYRIADDLGGEAAYDNLRQRAFKRGIRLASDMVPNHMGIDSSWVIEHPDWFISLEYSPFPAYSFGGPDLSTDKRASLYLEDHYYNHSDAAVVFKYHDRRNGRDHYIYHGNDGTSMPWNDTAQLNYLKPEVREAVIQEIIQVARRFPIIRFDAAMTLAKRHFQRLWFPQPGSGASIPSRSDFGMTTAQFNKWMPEEFWREVVERVGREVPDTLLLAEAFWLMEGYFVRTLGMHRVYNSAFMNLLRDEENGKYRQVMKNTLEFDPEILKRFVNFMNNPDERTAVDQFGKGDKYFAICLLMVTMPGLPMFGHGQIEGYTEKYGMEFKRAYWNEQPDQGLIWQHNRIIFPLLKKRYLFSGVENFRLYDFFTHGGRVNENVLAYSNRTGYERSLVVVHNKFGDTRGWLRTSTAFFDKSGNGLRQVTLGVGLGISEERNTFLVFRDFLSGLEYIRENRTIREKGLELELGAYKAFVFMDFREVSDDPEHSWRKVCDYLNGSGVPNLEQLRVELPLQQVLRPWHEIANPGYLGWLLQNRYAGFDQKIPEQLINEARHKYLQLLAGVLGKDGNTALFEELTAAMLRRFSAMLSLSAVDKRLPSSENKSARKAVTFLNEGFSDDRWLALFIWCFLSDLAGDGKKMPRSEVLFDQWRFASVINECLLQMGRGDWNAEHLISTVKMLMAIQDWNGGKEHNDLPALLQGWLDDPLVSKFLDINEHENILWFNQEGIQELFWWLMVLAVLEELKKDSKGHAISAKRLLALYLIIEKMMAAEKGSGFQVKKLMERLK
jgi:glycosidase